MKILVVDDDPVVSDFLMQAAEARGHTDVDRAETGEQALGCVVQNRYDLITLDIRMPGVSGLEILSPLRDMSPHAVIAVISGHIPDEPAIDFAGCADLVLHKPIDLAVYNTILDGAAGISQTMSELRALDESPSRSSSGSS